MAATEYRRKLTNPWVVVITLLLISTLNYADRYLISGLVDHLKADFGVGDAYLGLLMGPAFAIFFTTLGIPIARIADVRSRILVIAVGCITWSLCTALSGFATGPISLALARIGVGIGQAAFSAPAFSLLSAYFPTERRGRAFALLMLAVYFGQTGGYALGPWLADLFDWRWAFIIMGMPGIILALAALVIVKEPRNYLSDSARLEPQPATIAFLPLVRLLLGAPAFLMAAIAMGLGTLSGMGFSLWGPSLFARAHNLPMTEAAATFGILFSVFALFGALAFGAVADKISKKGMHRVIQMSAAALFLTTLCTLAVTWAPTFTAAKLLAIPSGLLGGGWAVGVMASLQYLLPDNYRATATAIFTMIFSFIGFIVGPWLAGFISQRLGDDASSLQWALTALHPAGLIGALILLVTASRLASSREHLAAATVPEKNIPGATVTQAG